MKLDLNNALNIMYANEQQTLSTIEPGTKEYEYYQGRVSAYSEAIELFCISEGMPLEHLENLTESDLDLINKEQKELEIELKKIVNTHNH